MSAPVVPVYEDADLRRITGQAIRPGGLELTEHAVGLAGLAPPARVLDVGCGTGATVEHLARRHGLRAVGVDPSRLLLTAGESRGRLLRAEAGALPFADASWDAAVCECVLSLLDDLDAALDELARVLRPGAALIVADLYARDPGAAGSLRDLPPASCLRGALVRDELLHALQRNGFRPRVWEDHSPALTALALRLAWQGGAAALAWCPGPPGAGGSSRERVRAARPGYFLLVAESTGG